MAPRLSKSARRVLAHVRYTPGITRHELADALDVSVTTVNPLVAQLMDAHVVVEAVASRGDGPRVGRPRASLQTTGPAESLAVVVWGHGVLDRAWVTFDHRIVMRRRTAIAGLPTLGELADAAREVLRAGQEQEAPPSRRDHNPKAHSEPETIAMIKAPAALVIGLPAPYEPGVGLGPSVLDSSGDADDVGVVGFAGWFEKDPRPLLATELGIPVLVENDANLGTLGETTLGAGVGQTAAIYVKLSGHGIGAGVTLGGQLFSGSHGFAGEIAHVRVDDNSSIICACGSRGCLEEKIGPNMLQQLHANYGTDITYQDLLAMVENGAPGPVRLVQDAGRVAGRALADICTFLNPGALILDAGNTVASEILATGVREQVSQSTPPFVRRELRILPSQLGPDAAVLGAVQFARTQVLRGSR